MKKRDENGRKEQGRRKKSKVEKWKCRRGLRREVTECLEKEEAGEEIYNEVRIGKERERDRDWIDQGLKKMS